jgi:hypothetical protein
MMLFFALSAYAGESEAWFGAGGNAHGSFTLNAAEPLAVMLQAEADFGFRSGIFGINGQVDVHIDPLAGAFLGTDDPIVICPGPGTILACPRPVEELNIQLGGDAWRVQAGIVSPPMGIEGWDTWNNTLPVFSEVFAAQSGTVIGGLAGYTIGEGPEIYAFGGLDTAWDAPEVGAGIAFDGDALGTWSGVYAMPGLSYYGALAGFSFYLGDTATLNVSALGAFGDFVGGVAVTGFGQLVLLPNGMVQPSVRVGGTYDPEGAFGFAPLTAAAGVNVVPFDWLGIQASADAGFLGPAINPRFTLGVNVIPQLPE